MGEKTLVIVESPTKAKTISKFLGKSFVVKASNGHVRDLPNNASEVPPNVKKESWARLGVNIAQDFEALYVIPANKRENVKALREALKGADLLYLATDEDREGESISWHLIEALKPKIPFKRLVFHEITRDAIDQALRSPREINESLVRAQETRRIVDRLYGYEVSPLLWKKMLPRLSAGRVQSVAVRLLVERERERIRFKKATYWGITGTFGKEKETAKFDAELTHVDGKRIALGKDFDPNTGKLIDKGDIFVLGAERAEALKQRLPQEVATVTLLEEKPYTSKPSPPFVTSTLQQEGNTKLRLSAKRTMQVAQSLYENGFITYMRTDSTTLSDEAIRGARAWIDREYGKDYLPADPRTYVTKVKNAQEAHEAIRPAGENFTPPEAVRQQLGDEAFRLYDLIWKRTVASQMTDARGTTTTLEITCGEGKFRTTGKTIEFPGYLRAYVEGSADPDADLAEQEKTLPKLSVGEVVKLRQLETIERQTKPQQRFTEASLIKELERLGIGRPSTWATVVETVLSRDYAFKKNNALIPTFIAMAVVGLLEKHFAHLLDYEFTARLEDDLDAISRGEAQNIDYLRGFYFGNGHSGLRTLVEKGEKNIDPREVCGMPLGTDSQGVQIEVRIGRYGPFLTNGTQRTSVPDEIAPDELTIERAQSLLETAGRDAEAMGNDPATGKPVYLKNGRFGPYVQLGESGGDGEKPKMASLLPGMKPENVNFDVALQLLSLPRTLGEHPETKEPVLAANGRFGPYVRCGSETRSIPESVPGPLEINLDQALELLKQPKSASRRSAPQTIREIGKDPASEAMIVLKAGRYGPYVTDGTINASLPRGGNPDTITLEEALTLIRDRALQGPSKKRGRGRGGRGAKKKEAAAPAEKPKETKKAKRAPAKKRASGGKAQPSAAA